MQFAGQDIFVQRSQLPDSDEDIYWIDLQGLKLVDLEGEELGTLKEMFSTGANDVMRVITQEGAEILIPYVEDVYVMEVSFDEGFIKVDWERE